ncbi:MAG: plasmid maintenance system killer protein [Deltaproteobacteria bacterium HGW-Deltaproteobacteria-6]|nr:MAG: plasmid maintenance system killer protein [Deltaproteobacteria bacterium HGW-Deltaproteobacteria-6]
MEIVFKDKNLDRLEIDAGFNAGHPPNIVKAYRRRMQQIRAAKDERDFYNIKSLGYEKLKGNRKHQHSMKLNDQWRLILEYVENGNSKRILIVSIEDYHR